MNNQSCLLCNGLDFKVVEHCEEGYKVLKCLSCGLVGVYPFPQHGHIENAYSEDYYAPWIAGQRQRRIRMWKKRLKTLNSLFVNKGRLLDIGCAEGHFLELAREDGWDVTGTEISSFAVSYIREKLGLKVFQGEIIDVRLIDKSFDAVTMWHVLEHTTDPIATLKEVKRIIKDEGVFILAVPNLNNYLSQWVYRIVKGKRMHLFSPEDRELHLYYFTTATIKLALEKAGFKVIKIKPDMGIIQSEYKVLNHIAKGFGFLISKMITDAIEVHAIPKNHLLHHKIHDNT